MSGFLFGSRALIYAGAGAILIHDLLQASPEALFARPVSFVLVLFSVLMTAVHLGMREIVLGSPIEEVSRASDEPELREKTVGQM
jgi:hypothetical protein